MARRRTRKTKNSRSKNQKGNNSVPRLADGGANNSMVVYQKPSNKPARRSRARRPGNGAQNRLVQFQLERLMAPGYVPYQPTPRGYTSGRVSSGLTRTVVSITTAANDNGCLSVKTRLDQDRDLATAVALPSTAWTVATPSAPATSTIGTSTALVADANVTAATITVRYLSSALNATGFIVIGVAAESDPWIPNSTVNIVSSLPSVSIIPVSRLVAVGSLTAFLTKGSYSSETLFAPSTYGQDMNVPFVAWSGLPTGAQLQFEIVRTFDFRISPNNAVAFPLDQPDVETESNQAAYRKATNALARLEQPVYADSGVNGVLSAALSLAGVAFSGGSMYMHRRMTRTSPIIDEL